MSENTCCPTCGAAMREYTHVLNKELASALVLFEARFGAYDGNPAAAGLGLTHNQLANWQKLCYWGLIRPAQKSGEWSVTPCGSAFLKGIPLWAKMRTYRAKVTERSQQQVTIHELLPGYRQRDDYVGDVRAASVDSTPSFL